MKIHDFNKVNPSFFVNPVVTVGFFDGIHKGHAHILKQMLTHATATHGETVVVTFWPHPRMILKPEEPTKLVSTYSEKNALIEKAGIHHLITIPFDISFSQMSSKEFIQKVLIEKIGMKHLVVGFDNHIGHNKDGYLGLKQLAPEFNFTIEQMSQEILLAEKISSSSIRESLLNGRIEKANQMLGYTYNITGKVISGKNIGKSIGFPTANILVNETSKLIPGIGVYAVWVVIANQQYMGMINIGYRPTIDADSKNLSIEVHIINFQKDIYEQTITISFITRIRDEKKFENVESLISQLIEDKKYAIRVLSE